MSSPEPSSDTEGGNAALDAAADTALRAALDLLRNEETESVSDETIQKLMTAGARLFAAKIMLEERYFLPFVPDPPATVTATDVVTTVSEMLRQVDLNTFDLSMWFSRPRYDE